MQSLTSFFEDNKLLASAAVVAAILVLLIGVFVLYRLLFGRRLRAATNGRTRQPRLGIVDAYDLDRQRQLVLVRRDNVEHLIMIGGPTDVVVESSIVRTQSAGPGRDKDAVGPLVGSVTAPAAINAPSAAPALAANAAAPALPPAAASLPASGPRAEPAPIRTDAPPRGEAGITGRTEPALGSPVPSPDRSGQSRPTRPIAVPDPAAPSPAGDAPSPQPMRQAPPRPAGLPPRPAPSASQPVNAAPSTSQPINAAPSPQDRPASQRAPLPPRPPTARPPLPPRPSLASSLPPRPPRPAPALRPEQQAERPASQGAQPAAEAGPAVETDPEVRVARGPEPAPARVDGAAPAATAPNRNVESLESLEEEMAKLLGRPTPRRDG